MQQRKQFIDEYMKQESSLSELCRKYGISRKTGYKWVGRFLAGCELGDRSRRPRNSPMAVSAWLEDAIVMARRQRPRWGPRKLRAALLRANPGSALPSASTFALIFKRNGLVIPRRRRRRTPPSSVPLAHATGPNAVWCMDFKGDFLVGRSRCYPLTVMDAYSRFLIACIALPDTRAAGARRALRDVFEQFGLPQVIRSDNGSPFASKAPAGLSELSVWWLKLGIRHERIAPGKPQQNGRHERMHLTLKLDTAMPPRGSRRAQQRAFDHFRQQYNEERPHEALGNRVPAEFFELSARRLPDPHWGRDFTYPEQYETTRVRKSGSMPWNDRSVFISTTLRHELLGLQWTGSGKWNVCFGKLRIGMLAKRNGQLRFTPVEYIRLDSLHREGDSAPALDAG
jgi:transposase InsO family protein